MSRHARASVANHSLADGATRFLHGVDAAMASDGSGRASHVRHCRIRAPRHRDAICAVRSSACTSAIGHRGPDDRGVWRSPGGHALYAHTRLSIIDPSPAGPPADADRRRPVHDHLQRRDLQLRRAAAIAGRSTGVAFRSNSDTEVLLAPVSGAGAVLRRAAARHVRVRDLGRARADLLAGARSLRHQAALLPRVRRRPRVCLRSARAGCIRRGARDASIRRRCSSTSDRDRCPSR